MAKCAKAGLTVCIVMGVIASPVLSQSIVVDHQCTNLSAIPEDWIDAAMANLIVHYAHTSHGSQLLAGMWRIEAENSRYGVAWKRGQISSAAHGIHLFDGQPPADDYVVPSDYWYQGGMERTRLTLRANGSINVSMFLWCNDNFKPASPGFVRAYLDSMSILESEFPAVKFVYATAPTDGTGPASTTDQGVMNGRAKNKIIRDYCTENNKVLFDFEDIESWDPEGNYYEGATDTCTWCHTWCASNNCNGGGPCSHSHFYNCYLKGVAAWWLFARLAGWPGVPATIEKRPDRGRRGSVDRNGGKRYGVNTGGVSGCGEEEWYTLDGARVVQRLARAGVYLVQPNLSLKSAVSPRVVTVSP